MPCDVNEFWAEQSHAFDTIDEVLKTLFRTIGGGYGTRGLLD